MALVVAGARYTKAGKAHPATAKSSLVYAAAATEEARILITHKRPRALDTCAVLIRATSVRILTCGPIFENGKLKLSIDFDQTRTSIIPGGLSL